MTKETHSAQQLGRVLQNYNYLGTEYYPQLIDKELFDRVQERRQKKGEHLCRGKHRPSERERILFSGVLVCGECGQTYSHIQPKRRYQGKGKAKWKCKNYLYQNRVSCAGGFITDDEVMEVTVKAINQVIGNREILKSANDMPDRVSKRYRELDRQIVTTEETEDMLTKKLVESYDRRVKEMDEFLQNTSQAIPEFDNDLVRRLISNIKVISADEIKIQFKSGIVMNQKLNEEW